MASLKIVYGARGNKLFFIDGEPATRAQVDAQFPNRISDLLKTGKGPDGHRSSCWPMTGSSALEVTPDRIPEAMKVDAEAGVPTDYNRDGQPIFRDRSHRREYLKAHGAHDRSGGYGD
jgi:hypothetical protein